MFPRSSRLSIFEVIDQRKRFDRRTMMLKEEELAGMDYLSFFCKPSTSSTWFANRSWNRTRSAGFDHITCKRLRPSQSRSLFTSSQSYFHTILANIDAISTFAKLWQKLVAGFTLLQSRNNVLSPETSSGSKWEGLRSFFDVGVFFVNPALWLETMRIVEISRIVGHSPCTCIHFCLWKFQQKQLHLDSWLGRFGLTPGGTQCPLISVPGETRGNPCDPGG